MKPACTWIVATLLTFAAATTLGQQPNAPLKRKAQEPLARPGEAALFYLAWTKSEGKPPEPVKGVRFYLGFDLTLDKDARPTGPAAIALTTEKGARWLNGFVVKSAVTDETGRVAFNPIKPGHYILVIHRPDKDVQRKELTLKKNQVLELEVTYTATAEGSS